MAMLAARARFIAVKVMVRDQGELGICGTGESRAEGGGEGDETGSGFTNSMLLLSEDASSCNIFLNFLSFLFGLCVSMLCLDGPTMTLPALGALNEPTKVGLGR